MFNTMNDNIAIDAVRTLLHVQFRAQPQTKVAPMKETPVAPQKPAEEKKEEVKPAEEKKEEQPKAEEAKAAPEEPKTEEATTSVGVDENGQEIVTNVKPDDDGIDRSNPTSKMN